MAYNAGINNLRGNPNGYPVNDQNQEIQNEQVKPSAICYDVAMVAAISGVALNLIGQLVFEIAFSFMAFEAMQILSLIGLALLCAALICCLVGVGFDMHEKYAPKHPNQLNPQHSAFQGPGYRLNQ